MSLTLRAYIVILELGSFLIESDGDTKTIIELRFWKIAVFEKSPGEAIGNKILLAHIVINRQPYTIMHIYKGVFCAYDRIQYP